MATVVVKSGDEARTSNTTLTDDTELSFVIGANETWVAYLTLYFTGGAGNAKITVTVPSGATGNYQDTQWNFTVQDFGVVDAITFSGGVAIVFVEIAVVNSSTAGTVHLQWAQNSSNITSSILKAFSSLVAVKQ